jgi:hypothetical protein
MYLDIRIVKKSLYAFPLTLLPSISTSTNDRGVGLIHPQNHCDRPPLKYLEKNHVY